MSNNKQSSVDAIIKFMKENGYFIGKDLYQFFEQAKAMHKEEIKDALIDGSMNSTLIEYRIPQYYNETFGGKNEQQ